MNIKELKREYSKRKNKIKQRLKDFEAQSDYFYELCFCVLTPQSNAYKCDECINILKENHFENKKIDIENILQKYTRFHRNKSKYLIRLKESQHIILTELSNIKDPMAKRDFLVNNVKGIGLKEASHYLRNIGYKNLAILDRHILKNLKKHNVITDLPRSLTRKKYLEIEEKFKLFSKKIDISMDELDLLFWSMETGKVFK